MRSAGRRTLHATVGRAAVSRVPRLRGHAIGHTATWPHAAGRAAVSRVRRQRGLAMRSRLDVEPLVFSNTMTTHG